MKTMQRILKTAFLSALLLLVNSFAYADGWSDYRTILGFGCHKSDGTCFVNVDGAPLIGGVNCVGNHIRWDAKNDANGKNIFALIAIAKATNKRVGFNISGCYSEPTYPTFNYIYIE